MICCNGSQFSPLNLAGYSVESELGYSTNCVSNLLKICTFIIYLAVFLGLFLYSLLGFIRDYQGFPQWGVNKRRFCCTGIVALAYVCLIPIWISGTFSRGKYILFPLTFWPFFINSASSASDMYQALSVMKKRGRELSEKHQKMFHRISYGFQIFQTFGFFLWWAIMGRIFFDNYWILNWVFIVGYVHLGVVCGLATYFNLKTSHVLLESIQPALAEGVGDKRLQAFVDMVSKTPNLS